MTWNWFTRLIPGTTRGRRRAAAALVVLLVAAVLSTRQCGFAAITAGPTPDVSASILAAQPGPSQIDRLESAGRGRMLATTIDAAPLTWAGAARCWLSQHCSMLPVQTGSSAAAAQAQAMTASVLDARSAALALLGGGPGPFPKAHLSANLGDVGGPSAGLMLTLGFVDAATRGDLTGGHVIAGTGEITATGLVLPIGGVQFKVAGAVHAGAWVFFVPQANAAAARAAAPAGLQVVAVRTAAEALSWLCSHGGSSSVCP